MIKIWKHHWLDSVLFALTVVQFCTLIVWATAFEQVAWYVNLAVGLCFTLLMFHNYSISSHEFVHLPWFRWRALNLGFSIFNSMNLAFPMCLYRHVHFAHHRFDNSPADPTSTFRYGKNGQQEHWISYSALGFFRNEAPYALSQVHRKREWPLFSAQAAAVVCLFVALVLISWRFTLLGFPAAFAVAQFLTRAGNYFGHYNATDVTDPYANSVCHYGRLWNWIMFNEGYHQEHHIHPQGHWLDRGRVRSEHREAMAKSGTHVETIPALLAMDLKPNPQRRR